MAFNVSNHSYAITLSRTSWVPDSIFPSPLSSSKMAPECRILLPKNMLLSKDDCWWDRRLRNIFPFRRSPISNVKSTKNDRTSGVRGKEEEGRECLANKALKGRLWSKLWPSNPLAPLLGFVSPCHNQHQACEACNFGSMVDGGLHPLSSERANSIFNITSHATFALHIPT